uniref:Uncharacterized protein n=1 Tax=Anopheles culicifacies TaxID=139723 RepID=A0A182MAS6_9DIPT
MNHEEEIPTRVTRGALRRRSVDQEATPQKPSGAAVSGTPNKTNSTTKRVNALNPIQESAGRPSTPIVGRNSRRRMSESIDTPTSLPNKLVQNLKGAETSSESGKRSRNTSLTEENLNELNVAYEGSSSMLSTRSRTPARVRASHETLISSGSPLTVTPAVRRSTRRNSITSDDGNSSVQSLPVTTPKISSGLRAVKDETIIEEDAGDDRAESVSSETSTRNMRSQSVLSASASPRNNSASPRNNTASPLLGVKHEMTPPRGTTPRVALTPLSLSKTSPRSKNVSFSDDSKRDDDQSAFPKTPTSLSKEVFIIVEDLRNNELKGISPKVDAVVDLSPKTGKNEMQEPTAEIVESGNQTLNETGASNTEDKTNSFSAVVDEPKDESIVGKVSVNDVSGIDVLELPSKVVEEDTQAEDQSDDVVNETIRATDQSLLEENKFPPTWSQPVRRSATSGIDEYSVRKQEEQERLEEAKESSQKAQEDSLLKVSSPSTKEHSSDKSENDEDDEEEIERNEFVDNEALEIEDYQSCDSMDSELRKEIEENEIPDLGEDLGSQDSEDSQDQEDDEDGSNDSWIVSDGDEIEDQQMDEDQLLRSSNDDLTKDSAAVQSKKSKVPKRKRIIEIPDDSDEEEENEINKSANSSKVATNTRRSATPVPAQQTSDIEMSENNRVATPVGQSPKNIGSTAKSPAKITSNKKQLFKPDVSTSEKGAETTDSSMVIFEDVNDESEKANQNDKETENDVSSSPKKSGTSRKSLPATKLADASKLAKADTRKSLPASTKMPTSEKTNSNEEEKMAEINITESKQDVMGSEENADVKISSQDNDTIKESPSPQVALEQTAPEAATTDKKLMPAVSLISAQFYIGGTKKRYTADGGDSNVLTATPKPKDASADMKKKSKPVAEKMNSKDSNSIVPNPFALANSSKLKSRVSLDAGTAVNKQDAKKSRLSLPTKLVEDLPSDVGNSVSSSQEPEPMEVEIEQIDAVKEDVVPENDDEQTDDDGSVQEVEASKKLSPKIVKPKPKALEDYNLANILVRCNEVMREEKERKKQLASVLRKKREEKKRQRELEKQEEQEAARNAANTSTDNDADPNNTSTGNEPSQQRGEPSKKKKRKPKVKNYLLEELAETKKERMEQALRHKLEVIERRKQRKKDRQLEKKKQLDKENGDSVSVTGGIGAKLEKVKKKQKAKAAEDAEVAKGNKSKEPPVRVALSAFAVFNQLQLPSSNGAPDGKQTEPLEKAQKVVSSAEKKQLLKTSDENGLSNQQQLNAKETLNTKKVKDSRTESSEEARTEPVAKKKQTIMSVSESSENVQQNVSSATNEVSVDRVVKPMKSIVSADSEPCTKDEKLKEKKKKKKQMAELTLNEADTAVSKQKKNKQIKSNGTVQDQGKSVQAKPSSAIHESCPDVENVGKLKSTTKKLSTNGALNDGSMMELSRKKPIVGAAVDQTTSATSIVPAKKRKREQQSDSSVTSTSRPAKHTKLQVLQRIESGGFLVENVTPDKVRLKRNFGFQERQATPAKQLGFKVSSLLPTGQDELRGMATSSKKLKDGQKKSKYGEQNTSLPLPVWTSSGVFFESAAEENVGDSGNKKVQKLSKEKSGYMQLKSQGKAEFNLKALRPGLIAEKPHRVDSVTSEKSVLNFKRQQLLEKTAHLREKKNQRLNPPLAILFFHSCSTPIVRRSTWADHHRPAAVVDIVETSYPRYTLEGHGNTVTPPVVLTVPSIIVNDGIDHIPCTINVQLIAHDRHIIGAVLVASLVCWDKQYTLTNLHRHTATVLDLTDFVTATTNNELNLVGFDLKHLGFCRRRVNPRRATAATTTAAASVTTVAAATATTTVTTIVITTTAVTARTVPSTTTITIVSTTVATVIPAFSVIAVAITTTTAAAAAIAAVRIVTFSPVWHV